MVFLLALVLVSSVNTATFSGTVTPTEGQRKDGVIATHSGQDFFRCHVSLINEAIEMEL